MTDSHSGDQQNAEPGETSSRGQRRAAARAKAQATRLKQKRRARRGRWALQGGLGLVVIAIIVGIGLVVAHSITPAGPGPANMAGDGITIGKGFKAVTSDALQPSETPRATSTSAASDTVKISIYLDYLCPVCNSFEKTNNDYIKGLVQSGAATVEYHPIALLTNQSLGTKYSQRSANAAACVATHSPDSYFAFNTALFARQPKEGTAGLTDAQLASVVKGVDGMTDVSTIAKCIDKQTYVSWVVGATQRALTGPISDAAISKIPGTPTILVNGQQYKYTTPFTTEEFSNFVVTAAGNSYTDNATATPTPTASPTPTPTTTPKSTPTMSPSPTPTP